MIRAKYLYKLHKIINYMSILLDTLWLTPHVCLTLNCWLKKHKLETEIQVCLTFNY